MINDVLTSPDYLTIIQKISTSFREAGGYPKAEEAIVGRKKKRAFPVENALDLYG